MRLHREAITPAERAHGPSPIDEAWAKRNIAVGIAKQVRANLAPERHALAKEVWWPLALLATVFGGGVALIVRALYGS